MTKRLGFKPPYREQLRRNEASSRFYALSAGVEPEPSKLKPKRERAAPRDLEGPVVAAISELLAVHPNVLFACRQNSGMASYEAASGKYAPVHFYRILTHGKELTLPDFWGILRADPSQPSFAGVPHRFLAIEAKAPGFKEPRTDREFRQANFLALVRNCGGRAGFACSAEDAQRIIESP